MSATRTSPGTPEEAQAYKEARNQLAHQALSEDQCLGVTQSSPLGCKSPSHYGEILLALKYLTYCQYSIARTDSSYAVRHRAETLDHPHYVSNGAMIAAAAMASVKIYQKVIYGKYLMNAEMYINEPRICGARGVKLRNRMSEEPHSLRNKESNMRPMPGRTLT